MAHEANKVHRKFPPCSCDSCLRAIHLADQRAAEIEKTLAPLDALGLHCQTAAELEKGVEHEC